MGDDITDRCVDCGGFDIEWMYKCFVHNVYYCPGCSCSFCDEDELDEYDYYEPLPEPPSD